LDGVRERFKTPNSLGKEDGVAELTEAELEHTEAEEVETEEMEPELLPQW